ncbi:aldo/keto reductase, partial [Pediococcus acidilactici]
ELLSYAEITTVLNQIELHPKLSQEELRNFLELHDIKVQAWSPLMQGQLLDNEVLKKIADKHGKSVAQIILRWDIQQDILVNV